MSKVVMALSGGIDSTTVLAKLLDEENEVVCVSFLYESKNNQYEVEAAHNISSHYNVEQETIDLSGAMKLFRSDFLKSGGDIPEGHYTDPSMTRTVIPGRNMIFLSVLAGYAWSFDAQEIAIGFQQSGRAIYPDGRAEFYLAMDTAIYLGTDRRVRIKAPFVDMNKTDVIAWGKEHKVPYKLTRTCYKDQKISCGKCGACVERKEAFKINAMEDPIDYEN